jgi:NMD protein affecting ribosome stability and mRNA decay
LLSFSFHSSRIRQCYECRVHHKQRKRTITSELADSELREYLQELNGRTAQTHDSISWKAYRSSSSTISITVRTFVIKHSIEWLPIGVRERRHGAATDTCPNCNQSETMSHLYTCSARTAWHEQFMTQLRKHLVDTSTAADIRGLIVNGIRTGS